MDEELKQLAALALRNAFWRDFSSLVNKYMEASTGLDVEAQARQMGDMTSIHGRDDKAPTVDVLLGIWTQQVTSRTAIAVHDCLVDALEHPGATEVHLRGAKVFERRNGEWCFTGA